MEKRLNVTVPEGADGKTVKDVARSLLSLSSTRLKKAKKIEGGITVNGKSVFVTHRLQAGDALSIVIEEEGAVSENVVPVMGEMDVEYEDADIMVICKPANMPVHPSAGHYDDSLANRYAAKYGGVFRPVNRLDAGTSGLMVAAKDAHVHALLCKALHTGDFERRYLAVAEGAFEATEGTVDAPIARAEGSAIKREVRSDGQEAVTHYRVKANNGRFSLVELLLETGRTHQIRVQFAGIGCPVTGDSLYGTGSPYILRHALHSWKTEFPHPMSGERITVTAPVPEDIHFLMAVLGLSDFRE